MLGVGFRVSWGFSGLRCGFNQGSKVESLVKVLFYKGAVLCWGPKKGR